MTQRPTHRPIIRTQQHLEDAWRELMGPLGFSGPSIWLMLIDADDRPLPHLAQIEEADPPPDLGQLTQLAQLVGDLRSEFAPGGRIAFLRTRPGSGGLTSDDKSWAQALYEIGRRAGVPVEVVHRACDTDLVPVPVDDALPDSAA